MKMFQFFRIKNNFYLKLNFPSVVIDMIWIPSHHWRRSKVKMVQRQVQPTQTQWMM